VGELVLAGLYPGVEAADVQREVGWKLACSADARAPGPPDAHRAAVACAKSSTRSACISSHDSGRAAASAGKTDSLAAHVRQLADSYLVAYFERHPDEATLDGVANGPHDRLPDNSPRASGIWTMREDVGLPG